MEQKLIVAGNLNIPVTQNLRKCSELHSIRVYMMQLLFFPDVELQFPRYSTKKVDFCCYVISTKVHDQTNQD